jgi:major membrane immunogen (membrane-anchored lipoprotein)
MIKSFIAVFILFFVTLICGDSPYKDGIYSGISRSHYTDEPYFGISHITIEKGRITDVRFFIRDSSRHELFDAFYEKHFSGNDEYIQQCRNDLKGVSSYPDSLMKYQDSEKVDAISGATWSYNIFKASVEEALASAKK